MPLELLVSAPPSFMTEEQHGQLQESTPSSFEGHAPILRLALDQVRCTLQPSTAWPDFTDESTVAPPPNGTSSAEGDARVGRLWVTDRSLSFLSSQNTGFSLNYPTLSLHAVSRSLPTTLQAFTSSAEAGCIYCQLDLSPTTADGADVDEEDGDSMAELWILPTDQQKLEPLFEALSYCASLHPSTTGDNTDGGHPFSSFGPFGTGLIGQGQGDEGEHLQHEADGAFDDAEEGAEDGSGQLSDSGRATLARLDALVQWPAQEGTDHPSVSSPATSFHSSDPRRTGTTDGAFAPATSAAPTNTLILVHLPYDLFHHPPLIAALLDLLHAYGELRSWTPLPSFGRAIVVYEQAEGAQRAKEALDRLLLPLMDIGDEEEEPEDEMVNIVPQKSSSKNEDGLALRAYYGDTAALSRLPDGSGGHLLVPTTDRNFLISPPGSPPVGWEPLREDPPNTNTLADDLIRALGSLRDRGLGVRGHTPEVMAVDAEGSATVTGHRRTASSNSLMPPPSVIIPPRQAATRSLHPLARAAYDSGHGDNDDQQGTVSLPGVTVQSMDPEEDKEADRLDDRMNKGLSISAVKATVESMRGAPASLNGSMSSPSTMDKITPTARPPLGE